MLQEPVGLSAVAERRTRKDDEELKQRVLLCRKNEKKDMIIRREYALVGEDDC